MFWKDENKWKEAGDGPFKKLIVLVPHWSTIQSIFSINFAWKILISSDFAQPFKSLQREKALTLQGEVSLFIWPPIWPVRIQYVCLYSNHQQIRAKSIGDPMTATRVGMGIRKYQHIYLFGWIQTYQRDGQLYSDTSPYKVSECSSVYLSPMNRCDLKRRQSSVGF